MKKIFSLTLAAVMAVVSMNVAQAQYKFGGLMMDHDGMMGNDMFTLSQVNFGFGTARSMSMAGAFTSLGADMASMGINPAGLGMYRSNDFSFSPLMGFQNAENNATAWVWVTTALPTSTTATASHRRVVHLQHLIALLPTPSR